MSALLRESEFLSDESFRYAGTDSGLLAPSGLATSSENEFAGLWTDRLNALTNFRILDEDWDGEGAAGIELDLIDSVDNILRSMRSEGVPPPSRLVPSPIGTIVAEWTDDEGGYVELEFDQPYQAAWMMRGVGEAAKHGVLSWTAPSSRPRARFRVVEFP